VNSHSKAAHRRLHRTASSASGINVREAVGPLSIEFAGHRPEVHGVAATGARTMGRCSLWQCGTPNLPGHRVGVVGHFGADDDAAADALLIWACRRLAAMGCTYALGPMDGNTWRCYRAVVESGAESPFLFEPTYSALTASHFRRHGFAAVAHYFSAVNEDLSRTDPRLPRIANRLHRLGVQWRPLDAARLDSELRDIYAMSRTAFQQNAYFADIGDESFLEEFAPVAARTPSQFTWIARQGTRPVGFVFACPDLLQTSRQQIDTVVVKTLAVVPDRQYSGLGQLLLSTVYQQAHDLGFARAIHALVRDVPHLRRISGRWATPFRRYALFGKTLNR
jgi:GNAT superfamily N-acetyltransferase